MRPDMNAITLVKDESAAEISAERMEEMRRAAAAAVAMALCGGVGFSALNAGRARPSPNGHASAWVVQSRIVMTNRWPG